MVYDVLDFFIHTESSKRPVGWLSGRF
jgi:hypothetical protein